MLGTNVRCPLLIRLSELTLSSDHGICLSDDDEASLSSNSTMMLAKCAASRNPREEGAVAVPTPEDLFDEAPDVLTEEDLLSDESIFIVNRRSSSDTDTHLFPIRVQQLISGVIALHR